MSEYYYSILINCKCDYEWWTNWGFWMRKETDREGKKGTWSGIRWGESTKAQQKEWKQVTSGGRRWSNPPESTRDLWVERLNLRWNILQWGEGTCRAHLQQKDRSSSEEWGCHPTVKTLTHNCSCLKELQGQKWRRAWGKGGPATGPKCVLDQRRSQGLTLLLRLWSVHKKGSIITALWKTQQAAERVRSRYLRPTNGQTLLVPVVKLGKSWKKLRRRVTL